MNRLADRRELVRTLVDALGDSLVVSGLGSPTYDVYAAGERAENFYLWGAMGGAVPLGLGLALAQPERTVVVITGDGEQLMGLGSLGTVGVQQPANLTIVVLDNGLYGETGGQRSHTGQAVDLTAVARACGIADARTVHAADAAGEIAAAATANQGPLFVRALISVGEHQRVLPPRDGVANKNAFRAALGLPSF